MVVMTSSSVKLNEAMMHLQLYPLIGLLIERSVWDSPGIDYELQFFWKIWAS